MAASLIVLVSPAAGLAQDAAFAVIPSPNQGAGSNRLLGTAAISASDAWSVGSSAANQTASAEITLAEHWNGSAWRIVPTPNARVGKFDYNRLRGISAVASNNVWAVGFSGTPSSAGDQSLIEHWDGKHWQIVPSPNPFTSQHLYAVAALSANDIWAVGDFFNQLPFHAGALIAHWDGRSWKAVPNPATYALWGVTAVAADDIWAAGGAQILHWDGSSWRVVASPQPPSGGAGYELRALTGVSRTDIWAVGFQEIPSGEGYFYGPLTEHWNGLAWQLAGGAGGDQLFGVTALSASSVWAVGVSGGLSFAERFDGAKWTRVPTSNVGHALNNTLEAVGAVPSAGGLWAVGEYYSAARSATLTERCARCT